MSGCFLKLKESMPSLSSKEQSVAAFIIEYPNDVINMSIQELAALCGTSISSVVRLCKSLGYSGYKELCRVLAADLASNSQDTTDYLDIRPGDSLDAIVKSVSMSNIKAIENTLDMTDMAEFERAVDAIDKANRVDFYGVGTSGIVAMDAHNKFIRINKVSMASADPHVQILSATSLHQGDVAVLISYSGETKDILETLNIIKPTGATIISITRYSKNSLSGKSDIHLFSSSSETLIRSGAMGSRMAQLNIIDMLYTAVASREYGSVKKYLDKTRLASSRKRTRSN